MSFLGRILGRPGVKTDAKIVLLGSSGAGKTTLVRYLETGEPVEDNPKTSLGIDIRRFPIEIAGWTFTAIDVGGQEVYQDAFWGLGVSQANAVIYVIDGIVKPSSGILWNTALFQFEYMLKIVDEDVPLLILINKQDLKEQDPLTLKRAINLYSMGSLVGRSFVVLPSSAKYGNGVQNAMEWLAGKLVELRNKGKL
ncbi:MAG: ADP-ribosylation factor-like protein [Candidatus Hodarchaeota archaeon]